VGIILYIDRTYIQANVSMPAAVAVAAAVLLLCSCICATTHQPSGSS
jgi:hypothetical protein